jgi:methionyl-tRNA formyltransferase
MNKNFGKKIAVAGCRDNTSDLLNYLVTAGYEIEFVLSISPDDANNRYHISGYTDPKPVAQENNIPVFYAKDYKLKTEEDINFFENNQIDLLIVLGWQRIIPKEVLDCINIGAVGMHGSCEPLPFGRGHSVLNWSCIEGRERFITNLFFYREKVDSGPIIATYEFDINVHDTCETLHFKYRLSLKRILEVNLEDILLDRVSGIPQTSIGTTYYPKRTPEDGLINWNSKCSDIYNLIRGVTAPYPGAISYFQDKPVHIWRGHQFDTKLTWNKQPGTIVEVFNNGKFIVQTRDFGFIVHEWEGLETSYGLIGSRFTS